MKLVVRGGWPTSLLQRSGNISDLLSPPRAVLVDPERIAPDQNICFFHGYRLWLTAPAIFKMFTFMSPGRATLEAAARLAAMLLS